MIETFKIGYYFMKNLIQIIAISFFVFCGASPALASASNILHNQQSISIEQQCSLSLACMTTKITTKRVQLPICSNGVNGLCEREARKRCDGVEPAAKYKQCIAFETSECEKDEKCRN